MKREEERWPIGRRSSCRVRRILGRVRQHFETEQWLPFPREVVFAFFANPKNLPPLMPSWQQARIVDATLQPAPPRPAGTPTLPGVVAGSGTRLLIKARVAPGVPLRQPWLALIEEFRWNEGFCDVQLKGPFAYWRHCHSVRDGEQDGQAGTVVRDAVEYQLPLDPLSRIVAPVGQMAMKAMFGYRHRCADRLLPLFVAESDAL